jgi:hypothetical protein
VIGQKDIEERLRQNPERTVKLDFGGHTQTVVVISADLDGLVCRTLSESGGDSSEEFWIAYDEVSAIRDP